MGELIEVTIDSVQSVMSDRTRYSVVVLKDENLNRYLHIWTGPYEGMQIESYRKEIESPRPLPYDLMKTVIGLTDLRIKHVLIHRAKERLFFSKIILVKGAGENEELEVDCRPSDAINLAIRVEVPICVDAGVLDKEAKSTPVVTKTSLLRKLWASGFILNLLVWILLGILLSWELGGTRDPMTLTRYLSLATLLGVIYGLTEHVAVQALCAAILLSIIWGDSSGWVGSIAGALLGGLVVVVIAKLSQAIREEIRRRREKSAKG